MVAMVIFTHDLIILNLIFVFRARGFTLSFKQQFTAKIQPPTVM